MRSKSLLTLLAMSIASGCANDLNSLRAAPRQQTAVLNAPMQRAVECLSTMSEEKFSAIVNTTFDAELGINEVIAEVPDEKTTRRSKLKVLYQVWPRDGQRSNVRYAVSIDATNSSMFDLANDTITACNQKFSQG